MAQQMPTSTVIRQVKPVSVVQLPPVVRQIDGRIKEDKYGYHYSEAAATVESTWLYTFDRMLVGTIELAPLAKAENGSTVKLLHGEWMEHNVPVNSGSIQQVTHVLRANNSRALRPVSELF
jgi:hypothetical protein